MRKESLITLTRPQFEAHLAQLERWYNQAHPPKGGAAPKKSPRKAATRRSPKESAPREVRSPKVTAENVDARMAELREKYNLAWSDEHGFEEAVGDEG
jgi:hypothetical protein